MPKPGSAQKFTVNRDLESEMGVWLWSRQSKKDKNKKTSEMSSYTIARSQEKNGKNPFKQYPVS